MILISTIKVSILGGTDTDTFQNKNKKKFIVSIVNWTKTPQVIESIT